MLYIVPIITWSIVMVEKMVPPWCQIAVFLSQFVSGHNLTSSKQICSNSQLVSQTPRDVPSFPHRVTATRN